MSDPITRADHDRRADEAPVLQALARRELRTTPVAELAPAELAETVTDLREEVHHLAHAYEHAQRDAGLGVLTIIDLRRQQAAFREQVRQKASAVAKEQRWCRQGLNEVLRELGLDPFPRSYRVRATVTAEFTVDDSWGVDSEAEAEADVSSAVDGIATSQYPDVTLYAWHIADIAAEPVAGG